MNNINKYGNFLNVFAVLFILSSIKIILLEEITSTINRETLTNIIRYSLADTASDYATIATTPKGNLICSATYYNSLKKTYYYGLKQNGRPYFTVDGDETEFSSTDSDKERNEGNVYGIQLIGSTPDDKEYILGIGNNDANFEMYDFTIDNPIVYYKHGAEFFGVNFCSFKYVTIFELKNSTNNYLLSVILQRDGDFKKYFHIFRLKFSSLDLDSNYPFVRAFTNIIDLDLFFCSCYETETNDIICFFINIGQVYTIAAFDYDIYNIKQSTTIANTKYYDAIFYKCIHFTGNLGVFLYFNNDGNIHIQIKKYEEQNFNNYFTSSNLNPIIIENNNYYDTVQRSDLIKIADKKFCYLTFTKDNKELHLFIFNNFIDEKFVIRHYLVKTYEKNNFLMGNELRMTLYNDFIALSAVGYLDGLTSYSYIILFSYPNSTDFSMDITDTLKSSENPIINFNEKCQIENNIFGYEPAGIKLLEFSNGLKLLNSDDKTVINKESIFTQNVELLLDEDIDLTSSLRIEFAMVVKDPPYSLYKDYSEIINNNLCTGTTDGTGTCDEGTYYQQSTHVGRTSYCDIIIDSEQISKSCDENCFICKKDTQECFLCKDNFWQKQDDNKKCTDEVITTTIMYNPPTTLKESLPSTFPEFISSTIPDIKPSTIPDIKLSTSPEIKPTSNLNIKITEIVTTYMNLEKTEFLTEKNVIEEEKGEKNCTIDEILNNECTDGKITINQIEDIKNNLLSQNYTGQNTIITTETVIIQLSTLEEQMNQENSNVSNIDLGDCENILRTKNNLGEDEVLIVYKTDIKSSDLSTTYVTYEVYDSSLNKLNLDVCSDTQITINVPVHLGESLDNLAKSLSDSGYNLFNENDSFYNDICATYTNENGTDMLLSDRKSDIYSATQNQSICQTDCQLESYNSTTKKAKCNCDVVTNQVITTLKIDNLFNKKEIAKSFYDTLANSNFQVMKCFKLVLDFSSILKNYGEILMTSSIVIFLITMIIYFILGNKKIHKYLYDILKYNSQFGNNKNNNFDAESVAENDDKKVIHENNNKNKNEKKRKKIRFKTDNAPPKKMKRNNNYESVKNKGNYKMISSTNDLKQTKSEGVYIKNKKGKTKKLNEIKNINLGEKELDTKKNIKETEENNKKVALETDFGISNKNFTETELDDLEYELAIIYDKRTFFQFYWSVLKQNQLIIFTFLPMNDFNLMYVKIALFIISFGLFITVNGFFFSDDTMHKVYEDNGTFDIIYQLPQIFYSSIISNFANILLKNLSLSENNILELKSETYYDIHKAKIKARKIERCLRIKIIIFFILSLILMLFFWYFISCFCAVYKNTQIILLKDTGISFVASLVYPFILSFLPGIFRIPALRAKNKNLKYLYKISSMMNWLI